MKKNAQKLGAVGFTIAALSSLVACSGTGSDTGSESGTISFPSFFWSQSGTQWQRGLLDKFKAANPEMRVDAAPIPYPDYNNKVYTQMSSGQAPDIVTPYDPQIAQWAREGLLEPLDQCLSDHSIDTSKLISTQKIAEIDGKTYGLLYYSNPRVLVYNRQMYDQAGVSVPKDLDGLKAAIAGTTDPSKQQFGFGTVTGAESADATYLDIMPVVAGFGGAFVKDGKPTADSKETVAALSFLKDAYDKGQMPKGQGQNPYRDAFIAGKIGSIAIGGFIFAQARETNPSVGQHLDAAPLPLPSGKTVAVNVFQSIPAGAKNKKAACDYIAMSLDAELQKTAAAQITAIPATGEVDQAFLQQNPYFQAVVDSSKTAVSYAPQGAEAHMGEVTKIVSDTYQQMLATSMTGEEAGAKIQSGLEKLLK